MISELTFNHRDEFNRKAVAQKVIALLQSDIDISPMVIDGTWGKGKTEFCFKLIKLMSETDSHHLIYVDAFKGDHANEPLMMILSEFIKILPTDESKNGFIQKALPAIRYGLKTAAKAGISHLLRQDVTDVADDYDKEIQKAADKAIDASVESILRDHVKANENLGTLQTALHNIAQDKPITIFIDELDRCRPDFAVDILEIIKHTFDVEGVSFVLITNKQQLRASINHCYGDSVDAHKYLDKFLKFTIKLPDTHTNNGHQYYDNAVSHYQNLIQESSILQKTKLNQEAYISFIKHIITLHGISLREVETLIRHLEIYQVITEDKGFAENVTFGYMLLRLIGVVMFSINPILANALHDGTLDAINLGSFLGVKEVAILDDEHPACHQVLAVMIGQECPINAVKYTPDAESEARWEDLIRQYFNKQGGFPPDKGERSKVIHKVLKTLSLNE